MKVSRFEDLTVWQKARLLTKQVYSVTSYGNFSKDYGLRDQIQRASVSIMSNIAEGFERGSTADYIRFVVMAKASCAEVRCQLYIAYDIGYVTREQFDTLMSLTLEVSRMLAGLKSALERRR